MATITRRQQAHYDVLAEALTADGRVVKRVEARADNLADVAEAFKLALGEAVAAHLPPARVRLTASRAGTTEIAVIEEIDQDRAWGKTALAQAALLDGKTKLDAPPVIHPPAGAPRTWPQPSPAPGVTTRVQRLQEAVRKRFPGWWITVEWDTGMHTYRVSGRRITDSWCFDYLVSQWTLDTTDPDAIAADLVASLTDPGSTPIP